MKEKIIATLSGVSVGSGLLLVIGTAGLSDFNMIDFKTIILRAGIGIGLMIIGVVGLEIVKEYDFD